MICGHVVASTELAAHPDIKDTLNTDPGLRDRPIRNLMIMEIEAADAGAWKGWVHDPRAGHIYKVTVHMKPGDRLAITGCLVGPLCRTEAWNRARPG